MLQDPMLRLGLSLVGLYVLPYYWDKTLLIGIGFALIVITSSRIVMARASFLKYCLYMLLSVCAYYQYMHDRPSFWDFLPGWLGKAETHIASFTISSTVMSLAGWLLLPGTAHRRKYLLATLSIQLPLCIVISYVEGIQNFLKFLGQCMRYHDENARGYQAWQFLWMLNYYLPVFIWSYRTGKTSQKHQRP